MKNRKHDPIDVDTMQKRTLFENKKLRQSREEWERDLEPKNSLPDRNAAGLNEKDDEDEEIDLYREEENRGTVEAT